MDGEELLRWRVKGFNTQTGRRATATIEAPTWQAAADEAWFHGIRAVLVQPGPTRGRPPAADAPAPRVYCTACGRGLDEQGQVVLGDRNVRCAVCRRHAIRRRKAKPQPAFRAPRRDTR